ncbi:MAG: hypothetical protein ABIO80_09805 [Sphingomicrobium sp.]
MFGRAPRLRWATLLLALCAGGVRASSPPVQAAQWTADPDDQFLLDVNIRQLRLGDGVRAYKTPEGTCVVLGDFLTALDVPMRIDLGAKRASGWAFQENRKITVDYGAGTAAYAGNSEPLAAGTVRETPDGWCIQTTALARWFGIGIRPVTAGSALMLQSEAKLPVELALERTQRAAHIHRASYDLSALPQVRIPYSMFRAPALDFVVSAGVTYRASDGLKVDRQSAIYAAGEIARLSYDAQVSTTNKGIPNALRLRAYRSDPDGKLLGPLNATHFGVGDVEGFDSRLTGSLSAGRGAVVTNRPLATRAAFDRTRFEGDLPSGWEAELYRNGELLGFAKAGSGQRYLFEDVQLLYGDNQIRIVLYGPQGQVRAREETINVGQDNVPAGKTWYWAGFNQPGRDLVALEKPPDGTQLPKAQATASIEHGIDERTSVGVLARAMLIDDQRVTFVEGTVRRSIGGALLEVGAAREFAGGQAAHAQLIGRVEGVNISAEALIANDFHLRGADVQSVREFRAALDAPLRIGRTLLPAHADIHWLDHRDGSRQLEATGRLAANFDRFNLATDIGYRRQYGRNGTSPPGEFRLDVIGSGHVGDVRLRGATGFDLAPHTRFRAAELSAYWSKSERVDWEAGLTYEATAKRARARLTHVTRLDSMALALTGEAASDGAVAVGFNLSFSLDPNHGLTISRRPLAQSGAVRATVYRDLNDNGVRDPEEPLEKGALVTTGSVQSERTTDARGSVTVGGLTAYNPITVGIDQTSLGDPLLAPRHALQLVVPRPGIAAEVEIGLVGGGDIEGAVVKSGGLGFEGLDLELVGPDGKVAGTARSDYDGFFLFERVPYGRYAIRIAATSAAAAKLSIELGTSAEVSAEKSIVRLGAIQVQPLTVVASAGDRVHGQ